MEVVEVKRGLTVLWGIVIKLGVGLAYLGFDVEACILTGEVVSFRVTEPSDDSEKSCEVGQVTDDLQVLITKLKRVWLGKAVV